MTACLWMAACSSEPENLRVWTPEDHAHPPDTQIDPNRVPQQEVPDLTVGQGGSKVALDFTSAEWQGNIEDVAIARTIAAGKAPNMPAFANLLTPQQIQELVKQVRKFGSQ